MEPCALKSRYAYGALNRLEQAVNAKGETILYTYNGIEHRGRKDNRHHENTGLLNQVLEGSYRVI